MAKALPVTGASTQVETVNLGVKAMERFVPDTPSFVHFTVHITFKSRFGPAAAWICKFMEYLTLS